MQTPTQLQRILYRRDRSIEFVVSLATKNAAKSIRPAQYDGDQATFDRLANQEKKTLSLAFCASST